MKTNQCREGSGFLLTGNRINTVSKKLSPNAPTLAFYPTKLEVTQ